MALLKKNISQCWAYPQKVLLTSSKCYKTFFGGNLENLDFALNWKNKNKPF